MPYKEYAAADKRWSQILVQDSSPGFLEVLLRMRKDVYRTLSEVGQAQKTDEIMASEFLPSIGIWNQRQIDMAKEIVVRSYPRLKRVLKATCVSRVYVLASLRVDTEETALEIKCPSVDMYVHEVLTLAGKRFARQPGRLADDDDALEIVQKSAYQALDHVIKPDELLDQFLKDNENKHDFNPPAPAPESRIYEEDEENEEDEEDKEDKEEEEEEEAEDEEETDPEIIEEPEEVRQYRERLDAKNRALENPDIKKVKIPEPDEEDDDMI